MLFVVTTFFFLITFLAEIIKLTGENKKPPHVYVYIRIDTRTKKLLKNLFCIHQCISDVLLYYVIL